MVCASVDSGLFTFANHGCDRSYNFGTPTNATESSIELGIEATSIYDATNDMYNPYNERRYFSLDHNGMKALRDISAGEEMLDNYLIFGGGHDQEDFDDNLDELQRMCSGGNGIVSDYEGAT